MSSSWYNLFWLLPLIKIPASRVFSDLLSISSKRLPQISPGYEGTESMLYFFYKIFIFRFNKQHDDIRSAYVYFYFFHEPVTSHNLET